MLFLQASLDLGTSPEIRRGDSFEIPLECGFAFVTSAVEAERSHQIVRMQNMEPQSQQVEVQNK
jgi:hypothetical protein